MRKKIGYAKIGRSIKFNEEKYGPQGDPEAPQLLSRLARRNPDVDWYVVGKHDGYVMQTMPPNVYDPWPTGKRSDPAVQDFEQVGVVNLIRDLDGIVVHLGQHGTSNTSIPMVPNTWEEFHKDPEKNGTSPLQWALSYGGFLVRGMNALGDRTQGTAPFVYICVDPRNFMFARDMKWPTGTDRILAQHQVDRIQLHERFEDPLLPSAYGFEKMINAVKRNGELWEMHHRYFNSGAELMILPDDWETWGQVLWEERAPVGVASTAHWDPDPEKRRSWQIKNYFGHLPNAELYVKPDKRSLEADLQEVELLENTVEEFHTLLGHWRSTLSLPPLRRGPRGDQWCVAKPMQCFAARTVCFMLPPSDSQGWIVPNTVKGPETKKIADDLWSIRDDWTEDQKMLARWLRIESPQEFHTRAREVSTSEGLWQALVTIQRDLLKQRWDEALLEKTIEEQLGLI